MRVPKIALFAATITAAIGLVFASSSAFVLAAGSDAGVEIYTAQSLPKFFGLVFFSTTTAWAFLSRRIPLLIRVLAGTVAFVVLTIATHAVVINFKRSIVEERWLLVRFDRLAFDAADGLALDWEMTSAFAGVRLNHHRDGRSVYVFTGVRPWRHDFRASADGKH